MRKIKILQCGDLHFDTPFKGLNNKLSALSKEDILEVFERIITLCKEEMVDVLLLTGDIFDNLTVNKKTLYFIKIQLERIMDIRVFISPGNHDPYNEKSFYKMIEWPKNTYIFTGDLESVYVEKLDSYIWGAAFNKSHINKSLLKKINIDSSKINIMTIHGDISSVEEGNKYNPITLREIAESGIDYIAIGHRHEYSGILREKNTCYSYSGCPQGRGFDELGDKGVVLGYVSKGMVDLKFIKTSKRNYYNMNIDISGLYTYEEIKSEILKNIDKEKRENNLYKIELVGEVDQHLKLREEILLSKIKDYFYFIKLVDKTEIKIDFREIANSYSVKGIFVKRMLDSIVEADDESKEIINMALKLGLQSLSEDEVKRDDY
ncbi:metallophosphoesterase family protein [Clostridium sp.]|uniref:metallophosphoesterase family protein n=1 Tax=Clostridium sp. TaxID=1506 RepID=UPI003F2B195B